MSSEQDEKRGRALVILVSAIPESKFREDLLSMLTVQAAQGSVSAAAAENYVGGTFPARETSAKFTGTLQLRALEDGGAYVTSSEISFVDSAGKTWTVPKGFVTTGSSIPRIAWSAVGSPFEGKTRTAAVFHDYFATQHVVPSSEVNRMFYEALIASGVDQIQAKVLYVAVQSFGPRFDAASHSSSN